MPITSPSKPVPTPRRAVVVMGVSASGKTMAATLLAARLGIAFVDGDDLHPPANVAKMASGHPLTDEDRWPWLDRIGATLADEAAYPSGLVVACSALRHVYRDCIRARVGAPMTFVFLDITVEEAKRRIAMRTNHFMPPSLVDSQFATLERPDGEPDVIPITRLVDPESTAREAADAIMRRDAPSPSEGGPSLDQGLGEGT